MAAGTASLCSARAAYLFPALSYAGASCFATLALLRFMLRLRCALASQKGVVLQQPAACAPFQLYHTAAATAMTIPTA